MNPAESGRRPHAASPWEVGDADADSGFGEELETQASSPTSPPSIPSAKPTKANMRGHTSVVGGLARHTLGLILLLIVVFLWTASNFLGSSIFADNTYAKPFFMTYLNTSCFIFTMTPVLVSSGYHNYRRGKLSSSIRKALSLRQLAIKPSSSVVSDESQATLLKPDDDEDLSREDEDASALPPPPPPTLYLPFMPTARLALTFCMLWFSANYFAMSCLQHTTVASATILTSTSSIWTLIIGAATHTEKFSVRKLLGVLASFTGVVLVSKVDLTSSSSPNTTTPSSFGQASLPPSGGGGISGPFPSKPPSELFLGDALALFSAIIYGVYTITLKQTTLRAAPRTLNLPLFFGLVGVWNVVLLWPLFPVLSATGIEPFALPPTRRVWAILLLNSTASLLSDICWAYAMLLTSPLLVTVGLSLTIPVSLVGEWFVQGRTEGWLYWVGALIVLASFVFVEREEVKEEDADDEQERGEGEREAGQGASAGVETSTDVEATEQDDSLLPPRGVGHASPASTPAESGSREAGAESESEEGSEGGSEGGSRR